MIGHYIANFIMLSPRIPGDELIRIDKERGFEDAIDDYNYRWTKEAFTLDTDDARLKGEIIFNPSFDGPRKKVAIIAHGLTAAKEADIKYAKIFYELGYNVIIFDERYFGESEARYCTLGMKEADDIKCLCEYARTRFGDDCFIGLHGESMGGASVLRMLLNFKPDFVVADCPFSDLQLLIKELARRRAGILGTPARYVARLIGYMRYKYDYFKVKPIDAVREADVPICFMHGEDDMLINASNSREMYELCKNPLSEIHIFKGADHALSIATDRHSYEVCVQNFVKKTERAAGLI